LQPLAALLAVATISAAEAFTRLIAALSAIQRDE